MSFCCRLMFVIFFVIVIWCANGFGSIITYNNRNESEVNNSTLELVHVLFRHGARTPVNTYPNDPYINNTFYPYGWGALTNDGKRELFQVGKMLRKRYRSLLEPYYSTNLLHAQASDSSRTQMSMALVLASMFPPKGTPMEWNTKYNWQPIPIVTIPEAQDNLLRTMTDCARYDEALKEVFQLPEVIAVLAENEELFRNLSVITGEEVTRPLQINWFYYSCVAEQAYGLELPDWLTDYFPDKVQHMAAQNYLYNVYTPEMRRIKGGPFLKKMFDEMQQKSLGALKPAGRKVYMYCGHDWTMANILHALNVWHPQVPGFSALATFELHKNRENGAYYVEIYYQNETSKKLKRLTVPGCDARCPLEKLIELSKDVLPVETFEKMCRSKISEESASQK